jgi:hypothetical protein
MLGLLRSACLALVVALAAALPALAGGAAVVELFTSQGCSTCPPADRLLARLAERDDVVALSLHVDYWDYLGWRDTFARPEFGERQRGYRDAWGKNVIYTPQMVVHGRHDVPAADDAAVSASIDRVLAPVPLIAVSIRSDGGMLKCLIEPGLRPVTGTVWIAKYTLSQTVEITRGENAGRTMTYRNVVSSLMRMGTWSGGQAEEVEMPHPEPGEGVAVWIQDGASGPIHAAAKIENPAR